MEEAPNPRSVHIAAPDDSLLRALIQHRPPQSGWRITTLDRAPEPDALVILDFDDAAGREQALKAVRSGGFLGPVVILGGESEAQSLDDEPIARPARIGTLLARIDAHGAEPVGAEAHMLGPYRFNPADRSLSLGGDGTVIRLTDLERRLLACLADAGGVIVGREELLARVWGYSAAVATHTVETHIWRLRQKIETDDPATRILLTDQGGYRVTLAD